MAQLVVVGDRRAHSGAARPGISRSAPRHHPGVRGRAVTDRHPRPVRVAADPADDGHGGSGRRSGARHRPCGLLAGAVVPSHIFSPPVRKIVEYIEYIVLALVVPFAAWALGLLQYIRYH